MRNVAGWLLAGMFLIGLAACGSDDDDAGTDTTEAATTETEPATDDAGATDADGTDEAAGDDAATDDAAPAGGGDDMIDTILRALGLSGDVLDPVERSCMNDELATSVGTLPDDLSLANQDLWDAVDAAAVTCGAEIGL